MTGKGKLSFEEFVEIQPESREIQEGNGSYRVSGFNLLISGSVVPDENGNPVPEGDMYVRAVSIAYLAYDPQGNLVDISDSLRQASVEQITIVGLGKYGVLVLPIGDLDGNPTRVDRGSYMVLRTLPTLIDTLPEILPGASGDHPHWNDVPSIHFDYVCEDYRKGSTVTIEPVFVARVMSDDYNAVLNNVMDIRSNVHVRRVEDENWIDRHSTTNRTGSVNLDFYTDLGIGKSRFTGTKSWGNYKVSSSGEWFEDMKAEMQGQLVSGSVVDPAFQTYIGFSGSIIQSGSIQEDISAGTADFEELKFTKFRVRKQNYDYRTGFEYVMNIDEVSKHQLESGSVQEIRDLPEEKDILYRRIPSSSNFSRVAESLVYIADSNKIYKTDKFGEVVLVRDYKQG